MVAVIEDGLPDEQPMALRRMKMVATGALAAAAAGYVGLTFVPGDGLFLGAARAATEAATVGGLADWFAVVALFRRPLGLPIPHVALLPNNKDRIGRSLGRFVRDHFIDPDDIARKAAEADFPGQFAAWLDSPENAQMLADEAATLLPQWVSSFDDAVLKERLRNEVKALVADIDLVATADDVLMALIQRGEHLNIVDEVADLALDWIRSERGEIERQVNAKVVAYMASCFDGYVAKALGVDTKWLMDGSIARTVSGPIADGIVHDVEGKLRDVKDPSRPLRPQLHALVLEHVQKLKANEAWAAKLEGIRTHMIGHRDFDQHFEAIWSMLRERLVQSLEHSREDVAALAAEQLAGLAERLRADEGLRGRLNAAVQSLVRDGVAQHRGNVGEHIAGIVGKWDPKGMANLLELHVGRDLQFIRLNGTIVGGVAGIGLFLVHRLLLAM
ncbi:DUF445 domain-containing protein [Azospirillum brasilense]|uniref:DUF445 domain-containing protein n=1 Tax=Azospirillum brasilense TaxID=192 RepID=UPI000E0B1083|nr:DUF445 domain-containing protein [Azospirillum brasilense]